MTDCLTAGRPYGLAVIMIGFQADPPLARFVRDGFLRLERAFPRAFAAECRARLWQDSGCDPENSATWTRPVIRLGWYDDAPFRQAANTPRLHAAFDQLVGKGRWVPRPNLGSFPLRFPSPKDPDDTGWHVDVSFAGPDSDPDDFATWRVNVTSRGRALVMLFLFSDVGEDDAPTRIRVGSHLDVARRLAPAGEAGLTKWELDLSGDWPQAQATGEAGTVYLCHPFLIHAAQRHRGTHPRFLAQPTLHPAEPLRLDRAEAETSPVEHAIRLGLQERRSQPHLHAAPTRSKLKRRV